MRADPTRAGRPTALPAATWTGGLLAGLLVAAALVTIHDLAAALDWTSEASWTTSAVRRVDGLAADSRVGATGVVLVVVGILLVGVALRPARRTHRRSGTDDVWISEAALGALSVAAARDTPGVADASARVGRRRVVVSVRSNREGVGEAVETNVDRVLTGLSDAAVTTRVRPVAS